MSNLATITNNILADSGIDDINVVVTNGSYANPAWITSLAWSKITGAPANIITGTGAAGQVAFFSGTTTIGSEINLLWDSSNNRLGIGVIPTQALDVVGKIKATDDLVLAQQNPAISFDNGVSGTLRIFSSFAAAAIATFNSTGVFRLNQYGTGARTGTRAYDLAVDASGNVIEVPVGAGTITGGGTAGQVPYFNGPSSIASDANFTYNNVTNVFSVNGWVDSYRRFRLYFNDIQTLAAELYEDGASTNGGTLTLYGKASGTVDTVISAAPTKLNYINNAANVMIGWNTDQGFKLAVNGDFYAALDARVEGKMGIGAAPQSGIALYIKGNSVDSPLLKMQGVTNTVAILGDTTTGTTDVGSLLLYNDGTLRLRLSSNTGEESFINAGNFVIGSNTGSGYKVEIFHSNEDALRIHNTTTTGDALIAFTNADAGFLARIQGLDGGGLQFDVGNGAGGLVTNALRIVNTGAATFSSSVTTGSNVIIPSGFEYVFGNGNVSILGNTSTNILDLRTNNTSRLILSSIDASFSRPITVGPIDGSFLRTFGATDTNLRWAFINSSSGVFSIQQQGDGYANQGDRLTINRSGAATFASHVNSGGWFAAPNEYGLTALNAAGTAGRVLIKLNASNQIEIGRDSDISAIRLGTAAANGAVGIASNGSVEFLNRISLGGVGDQTYASLFVGGATTSGTNQYAILLDPQLAGSGDNYGLFANARIRANTAVNNAFGVYIPSAERLSGATIVNNYALYIANQTSGSSVNYSIYSSGGTNYFGGRVGIGVTIPGAALHVNSSDTLVANFNCTSNGTYLRWQNNGTSFGDIGSAASLVSGGSTNDFTIHARSTYNIVFAIDFATKMLLNASGNLSINNTNNTYRLDVTGNVRALTASSGVSPRTDLGGTIIAEGSTRAGLYILTSGTAAGSYGSIWWGNGNTNTDAYISVQNDTRAMDFGTADGFRMRITATGPVVIGGTTPINAATGRGNLTINGGTTSILNLSIGNGERGYLYHSGAGMQLWNVANGDVEVGANNSPVGYFKAVSSGSRAFVVGEPTALATSTNRANITINGGSNSILAFGVNNNLKGYLYNNNVNFIMNHGAGDFIFETNTATPMTITSGGLVGIRTTPNVQFAVNGSNNGIDFETNNTSTFATSIFYTIRETGVSRTITTGGYSYGPSNPLTMILTQNSDTPLGMYLASDNSGGAGLKGYKSRGTVAAPVSVNNGDTIFSMEGWAFHGSGPNHAKFGAGMRFVKDDTFGTANTFAPQRTEFYNANSTTTTITTFTILPNANCTAGGSMTATSFFESSDSRIKTLLDNNVDYSLIANVGAKYYKKGDIEELGYFAQDFEQILPSAVYKDEKGLLNLSYTQVHTAKIAALEARVKELEQQLKNK